MIGKILKGFWTHLQITFNDNYTIEGFEKTNKKFKLPDDLSELDSATKRQLTICNLFANQNLSIIEIVKVLDSSLHQVIPTLIDNGLIKERRRNRDRAGTGSTKGARNASLSILPDDKVNAKPSEPKQRSSAAKACASDTMQSRETSLGLANLSPSGRPMAS